MNSLAGLLSTVASIWGGQHGNLNISSISTLSVTGGAAVICGALVAAYTLGGIRAVRKEHIKEVGKEKTGEHGEGVVVAPGGGGDLEKLHGRGGSRYGGEAIRAERGDDRPIIGAV